MAPGELCAQDGEDVLQVTIGSASGNERHPLSRGGVVDRVGLRPDQLVPIALQLPTSYAGRPVAIGPLDGGQLIANENLSVSVEGRVQVSFQAGHSLGLYRLLAQIGTEQYVLQFYVFDPDHPETHPRRVRIE